MSLLRFVLLLIADIGVVIVMVIVIRELRKARRTLAVARRELRESQARLDTALSEAHARVIALIANRPDQS